MSYEEIKKLIKQYQEDGIEIIEFELFDGYEISWKNGMNTIVFNKQGTEIRIIGAGYDCIIDIQSIKSISI